MASATILLPRLTICLVLQCSLSNAETWWLARSAHFEVYSHAGQESARAALAHFEAVRALLAHTALIGIGGEISHAGAMNQATASGQPAASTMGRPPIRVIEFSSLKEYDSFRPHRAADAYYVGTEAFDYIVMPPLASEAFGVAAHEYAHFILHEKALKLPDWLSEGLAEVFSNIRTVDLHCEFNSTSPLRMDTLRRRAWLPLSELFGVNAHSAYRDSREAASVFYAESWALTHMLISSPAYSSQFEKLVAALNSGTPAERALGDVYAKSPESVAADLHLWISRNTARPSPLVAAIPDDVSFAAAEVSAVTAERVIAELLVADGEWSRADEKYRDLIRQNPQDSKVLVGFGALALRRGNNSDALNYWRKAMQAGDNDPALCYRFALLADEAGLPREEVAAALERAISSQPDFPDARYRLALLRTNLGDFEAAVTQLKAMRTPPRAREFSYWSTLSYALEELGKREEAVSAAQEAMGCAKTPEERTRASVLTYTAKTDLHVQFERDSNGQLRMVTARAPHGEDWNPFIEAGDRIERVEGQLRTVQCGGGKLVGFAIETPAGALNLSVPDPTHVLMRNSPGEFSCGPQNARTVKVEYAKGGDPRSGLLRGMEFR